MLGCLACASDVVCIVRGMKTPDISPVQIIAITAAVLQFLLAFGVELSPQQQDAILGLVGVLAAAVLGDAHIRGKRAANADKLGS